MAKVHTLENDLTLRVAPKRATPEQLRCAHNLIEVDEAARTINCQQCQKVLDPFVWIWERAVAGERIVFDIKYLEGLRVERQKELDEVERRLRNLKAQARRATVAA